MWESLWRRTVTLSREYSVLWFPVILADVAGFALRSSRKAAASSVAPLILRMFHGHSVLIGRTGNDASATATALVFIVVGLIGFVLESAQIVFYSMALFITARMVWERAGLLRSGGMPRVSRAIAALSVRGLLVAWALGTANALILWVVMNARWSTRWHALATWWIFNTLISAVSMSAFAFVMVPPAMRLLAEFSESLDERSIRLGRKCAIGAVVASAGLMILEHVVLGIIYGSHAVIVATRGITSVIAALPYAPLYIALSLLTRDKQVELQERQPVLVPGEA